MHAAIAAPGNSRTILTHLFGRGLEDDRYRVERFQAMADGDIRRWPGDAPATRKGRRKAGRTIASLKAVRALRPARTEIIVCTGLRIEGGVQLWGDIATGLFCERRQLPALRQGAACARTQGVRVLAGKRNRAGRARDARLRAAGKPRRNPERARAYERDRSRRRAAECVARGLCAKCGKEPPVPDRTLCAPCAGKRRAAERARYAKARAAGRLYGGRDPKERRRNARGRTRRR